MQGPKRSSGAQFERVQQLELTNRVLEERVRTLEGTHRPGQSMAGAVPTAFSQVRLLVLLSWLQLVGHERIMLHSPHQYLPLALGAVMSSCRSRQVSPPRFLGGNLLCKWLLWHAHLLLQ